MTNRVSCWIAGQLAAVLALLPCLVVSAALERANRLSEPGPSRRQVVEEAFAAGVAARAADRASNPLSTAIEFATREAHFVRLVIHRSHAGAPGLDELEIYGPDSALNLALASRGAVPSASSLLPGYAIHAVAHLNDGLYGNDHSWIAATAGEEWAQIELPAPMRVARVVFSRDRNGRFVDRQVLEETVAILGDRRVEIGIGLESADPLVRDLCVN